MGWGRMLLLGDFGQQMDLEDQRRDIERLKRRLQAQPTYAVEPAELPRLTAEVNELKLYIATIFRALVSKNIVTHDELRELIEAVDLEDGKVDRAFHGDVNPAS